VEYIDRGYDHLVDNLRRLGADIWRETVSDVK
jgi:UDP-N-acetylglucosamine 1-carboxyvinyltransferase